MFGFFKRKNKNNESPKEQTSSSQFSTSTSFENQYSSLLKKHKENLSALSTVAQKYTSKDDYNDKKEWLDALAICDVALQENKVNDTIKELYRQIYTRNWNKYVSMEYNDTDYKLWFNLNKEINDRFIKIGHTRGYCEQSDLYGSARRGYRDLTKKIEYLREGVKAEDPASLGDYGYGLYLGLPEYGDENKEEGRRLVERSIKLGYESAQILLLYIDFYDKDLDDSVLLQRINEYIEKTEPIHRKPYHLLADYYLRKENNLDKAVEAMKKGIAIGGHYCEYLLGMNYLNGRLENADKNEGIQLLENAYNYHVVYAANFLGQYYNFGNDENTSIEKSITWHEKAALYCYGESSFELACIYLYNEKLKDIPKGLAYLEQAIEDASPRALSEKAFLILESDLLPKDIEEVKQLLEKAMALGNEYAPYRLGLGYQNAEFVAEPDYKKALELFELGAERGHLYSIELSGNYYRVGVGGEDEIAAEKAVKYLTQAIELGSNYARVELAFCYETGFGVDQDYQKAFDLYQQAADNNYPYANTKLAVYYEDGVLGEENTAEAFKHYQIAAEAGLPDSLYHLGRYYKYAVGIPENPEEALKLFNQAAEAGSAPGLTELALSYEQEYGGLEFDAAKIIEYMTKAAEMGYTYAQYKLASYYYYGLVETDLEKAIEWYTKAYEQGYPYAALMLGEYYLYNMGGGETQYEKAFEYFKFAEEQNVISEGLGVCYEYGLGVEENETEAFKYYSLSANENYTAAKYRLGLCYKYGRGTTENLTDAYRWLSDAGQNGNYNAQYETAMMLLNGEGVSMDQDQAIQMLTKIAEDDHDSAQFELGNCYLTGKGVAEDEVQAMYWYQKAADNGNEQAQKLTGKRERRKR